MFHCQKKLKRTLEFLESLCAMASCNKSTKEKLQEESFKNKIPSFHNIILDNVPKPQPLFVVEEEVPPFVEVSPPSNPWFVTQECKHFY